MRKLLRFLARVLGVTAYWAGDDYTLRQLPHIRAWWHLSKVSMAIWMSRHWTTEEIASAAYAVAIKWPPRTPRPVSPES